MPDLKEVRAYHPAMIFSTSDTLATPHFWFVLYPNALPASIKTDVRALEMSHKFVILAF
jgi:hypothetical protein